MTSLLFIIPSSVTDNTLVDYKHINSIMNVLSSHLFKHFQLSKKCEMIIIKTLIIKIKILYSSY